MPRSIAHRAVALASLVVVAPILTSGAACGHSANVARPPPSSAAIDTERYRELVDAQVQPFLDAELISGLVIGLYNHGKTEIYGFGRGPAQGPPDGDTLFELGPITATYTELLLADAVQRREVDFDSPVAELVPPGVTVPIRDKVAITVKHLALHSSGLPAQPPSVAARGPSPDPYRGYGEDALYSDLIHTELDAVPGTQIAYSTFGLGLLGNVLGRKLGGFGKALDARVLRPLGLTATYLAVPAAAAARRATGSDDDLAKVPPWTFDALAAAGGLVSSARDQLRLIDAELDAASGGTQGPLRRALKLTQEPALDRSGNNEGMGWLIDSAGRYVQSGSSGGSHAFLSFDPKTGRGVVLLTSTAVALVDRLADAMYRILDGAPSAPVKFASPAELAEFAGSYDFSGAALQVEAKGKRLYLSGPGEPPHRLLPISDHEFWLEALQSLAVFERQDGKVVRLVFGTGDRRIAAPRTAPK